METIEQYAVEISIAGKNVTGDVSPYLSKFSYTDKEEEESDDITLTFEDVGALWQQPWYPQQGDTLEAKIGKPGATLDCGFFEIDEVEFEGPPDTFNVKAIGTAISKTLRTKNSKAFEKQSLREIAKFFADKHGLKLTGNTSDLQKIEVDRKTQDNQTDMAFLAALAREYGIIFSVRGDQLVFIDIEALDAQASVLTIDKSDVSKFRFTDKTAQVFTGATVATRDMKTNTVKKWSIEPSGKPGEKDTLIVGGRVENEGQAQAVAKGSLKNKNKDKITASLTLGGNIKLVAGINVDLTGFGEFSGKWHIVSSTHTVDKNTGYMTDLSIRKILAA